MEPSDGITVNEFVRLMQNHATRGSSVTALSHSAAFSYLQGCVEQGLLSVEVGRDGLTRYRPTARLLLAFGGVQ
jgi:hypothetical protein